MKLTDYILDKLFSLIMFLIAGILAGVLLWLIEIKAEFIIMIEFLFGSAYVAAFIWDYLRKANYYRCLWKAYDRLDDKTILAEILEKPYFLDGKILCEIIRQTNKHMKDRLTEADKFNQEYREYIEMWVHEVKTPITSAHLMVENDKNITTLHIDDELRKIERFVEQALYYARSTAVEKDFKLEQVSLKDMVHKAVKNYSRPIIQAGGQIHFENLDMEVLADKKSCTFIIEQIIANSVKYNKGNLQLAFRGGMYEGGSYLTITDNGIGIKKADLPRIFDKGYTGENGRSFTKSTGIGLYLCKKLCTKMNMDISAESVYQSGTTMKITFPESTFFYDE